MGRFVVDAAQRCSDPGVLANVAAGQRSAISSRMGCLCRGLRLLVRGPADLGRARAAAAAGNPVSVHWRCVLFDVRSGVLTRLVFLSHAGCASRESAQADRRYRPRRRRAGHGCDLRVVRAGQSRQPRLALRSRCARLSGDAHLRAARQLDVVLATRRRSSSAARRYADRRNGRDGVGRRHVLRDVARQSLSRGQLDRHLLDRLLQLDPGSNPAGTRV